jgi:hypothetical protein
MFAEAQQKGGRKEMQHFNIEIAPHRRVVLRANRGQWSIDRWLGSKLIENGGGWQGYMPISTKLAVAYMRLAKEGNMGRIFNCHKHKNRLAVAMEFWSAMGPVFFEDPDMDNPRLEGNSAHRALCAECYAEELAELEAEAELED